MISGDSENTKVTDLSHPSLYADINPKNLFVGEWMGEWCDLIVCHMRSWWTNKKPYVTYLVDVTITMMALYSQCIATSVEPNFASFSSLTSFLTRLAYLFMIFILWLSSPSWWWSTVSDSLWSCDNYRLHWNLRGKIMHHSSINEGMHGCKTHLTRCIRQY